MFFFHVILLDEHHANGGFKVCEIEKKFMTVVRRDQQWGQHQGLLQGIQMIVGLGSSHTKGTTFFNKCIKHFVIST
jgi:hypothetical protein